MAKPMTADLVSETELRKAADVLREKYDVIRIILFSSKVDGKASKDSDIDICILIKPSTEVTSALSFMPPWIFWYIKKLPFMTEPLPGFP